MTKAPTVISSNFILVLVVVFLASFSSWMVSSVSIPFLIKEFVSTKEATAAMYGVLMSVSSVATTISYFVGGFLGDRLKRGWVILVSLSILTPTLFIYTFVSKVYLVAALYFVQMFSIGLSQPAFLALVADLSKASSRGKAYGIYNTFWFGSQVPAPLLGGFLADVVGLRFPFGIAALVSLTALAVSFSLAKVEPQAITEAEVQPKDEKKFMPFSIMLLIFGTLNLLMGVVFGMMAPLIILYYMFQLDVSGFELGLAMSLGYSLVTAVVQLPGGKLTDRVGRKPLVLFSSLITIPLMVAVAYTRSLFELILISAALVGTGFLAAPAFYTWLMDFTPSSKRASAQGLVGTTYGIGMVMGPVLSTWLYYSQPNIILPFAAVTIPSILQIPLILKLKETK